MPDKSQRIFAHGKGRVMFHFDENVASFKGVFNLGAPQGFGQMMYHGSGQYYEGLFGHNMAKVRYR